MRAIGIDPGVTGAIACVGDDCSPVVYDIPITKVFGAVTVSRRVDGDGLLAILKSMTSGVDEFELFCEAVRAREGDRNSMQSQGSLMRSLGAIEAVCDIAGHGIGAQLVEPQTWMAFYGLVSKSREVRGPGELPEVIRKAATLHPGLAGMLTRVKDNNRADALLIARYGLRKLCKPTV